MKKTRNVWVVVADGAKALFLTPNDDLCGFLPAGPGSVASKAAKLRSRELKSDRPGRSVSSSRDGTRHAIEPKHDHHKLEKHRFSVALTGLLDRSLSKGAFDDLIIVAPRRSLGELRGLLSDQVRSRLQKEIAKDLTHHSVETLWEELAPIVAAVSRRRSNRDAYERY